MGIRLLGIAGIQLACYLLTLSIGALRDPLQENFGLEGAIYKNMFSEGVTWSVDQFISHLGRMYGICALIALVVTIVYYFTYEKNSGGLKSRRSLWWIIASSLVLAGMGCCLLLFKLPQVPDSGGLMLYLIPYALLTTVVPYYLSTLLFCGYDAPGSYPLKNLSKKA